MATMLWNVNTALLYSTVCNYYVHAGSDTYTYIALSVCINTACECPVQKCLLFDANSQVLMEQKSVPISETVLVYDYIFFYWAYITLAN